MLHLSLGHIAPKGATAPDRQSVTLADETGSGLKARFPADFGSILGRYIAQGGTTGEGTKIDASNPLDSDESDQPAAVGENVVTDGDDAAEMSEIFDPTLGTQEISASDSADMQMTDEPASVLAARDNGEDGRNFEDRSAMSSWQEEPRETPMTVSDGADPTEGVAQLGDRHTADLGLPLQPEKPRETPVPEGAVPGMGVSDLRDVDKTGMGQPVEPITSAFSQGYVQQSFVQSETTPNKSGGQAGTVGLTENMISAPVTVGHRDVSRTLPSAASTENNLSDMKAPGLAKPSAPQVSAQDALAATRPAMEPAPKESTAALIPVPQGTPTAQTSLDGLVKGEAAVRHGKRQADQAAPDRTEPLRTIPHATQATLASASSPDKGSVGSAVPAGQIFGQTGQFLLDSAGSLSDTVSSFDRVSYSASGSFSDAAAQSRGVSTAIFNQPEIPRHISHQIAAAMHGQSRSAAELHLSPAELGRVRISLSSSEAGMVVSIIAERPETLELMRRHVDQLAQDFHEIGYETAEFNFGQNTPDQSQNHTTHSDDESRTGRASPDPALAANPLQPLKPRHDIMLDRVDMRL